jgi:hypothetical protein
LIFSDEITESEEKSETSQVGSSTKMKSNCSKNVNEKTSYESETESEQDSQHPDFLEKLDDLIKKFKHRTDHTVRKKRDSYVTEDQNEESDASEQCLDEAQGKMLICKGCIVVPVSADISKCIIHIFFLLIVSLKIIVCLICHCFLYMGVNDENEENKHKNYN